MLDLANNYEKLYENFDYYMKDSRLSKEHFTYAKELIDEHVEDIMKILHWYLDVIHKDQ